MVDWVWAAEVDGGEVWVESRPGGDYDRRRGVRQPRARRLWRGRLRGGATWVQI